MSTTAGHKILRHAARKPVLDRGGIKLKALRKNCAKSNTYHHYPSAPQALQNKFAFFPACATMPKI